MSELIQSEQHPDADQLSAFVEHALSPHEHEQTLTHLAVCPDCRAIVALSLPPLESPATQPEPTRRPWLSGWILAWPTAAALAGLAFFIIHLHNKASSTTTPAQIATTHPPPPLPTQNVPPISVSTPPSPPAAKPLPRSGASATSTANLAKPEISSTVINGQPIGAAPTEGRNSATLPQAQAAGGASTTNGQFALHGTATGTAQSPSPMTAQSPQPNIFTAANAAALTSSPSPAKTPAPATPSKPATASSALASTTMDALSVDADTNASATTLTASGANAAAAAPTATPTVTLRATPSVALPSSLPALSTATNGNQILAIDTQNSLFYSEDGGKHWSAIAAPWRGRAIRVNLARPANSAVTATRSLATSGFGATGGPIISAARTTGTTLAGTITDATGAVISGASVTVSNAATKTARTVQTDRNGHYLADNLTPGSYQIEATAPGFSKQQLAAVAVTAAQQNQANLTLTVGSASETVTVEASSSVMPLATSPAPQLAAPRAALKKAAPSSAAIQPPPLFEITTDNGDRWTSPDGKTWTQK